jgi:hypothetical protein
MKVGDLFKAVVNADLPMDAEVVVAPEGAVEVAASQVAGAEGMTLAKGAAGLILLGASPVRASGPDRVRALVLRTR